MASPPDLPWRRPLGATAHPDATTTFRVWAPRPEAITLRVGGREHALAPEGMGVFATTVEAAAGADYHFVLDGKRLPDPATRSQPKGLRGPSRVVDPAAWAWTDADWRTPALGELVIYELHVGTFTQDGTFDAAVEHLAGLAQLGVTAVEVMPVADFPGLRGWGYDGVYLSATHRAYGGPDAFARFVDAAHAAGIAVILDVVYNHLGASGVKAIEAYGPYFTERYETFWGKAINYDDEDSDPVREWVAQSAEGWIRDLHVDGLRLDAVHAIFDAGVRHLVAEVTERVHAVNPAAIVIAESGLNDPKVIRPAAEHGWGCDAQWADDFHHALRVLLTGDTEGYYAEFGTVADLAKAFHRPFVHDGQFSTFRRRSFGAPAEDRRPEQFVVFAANHDQVGNRAFGDRLRAEARPLAALVSLLSPFVPMIFMGDEYGEPAPFQFFSDHIDKRIATATRDGRRREFASFAQFAGEEIPDPQDAATFARSKLTRRADPALLELHRAALAARRTLSGEAQTTFDEEARWLRVRRDGGELVANFADEARELPVDGREVVVGAGDAALRDGVLRLGPRSGALVR